MDINPEKIEIIRLRSRNKTKARHVRPFITRLGSTRTKVESSWPIKIKFTVIWYHMEIDENGFWHLHFVCVRLAREIYSSGLWMPFWRSLMRWSRAVWSCTEEKGKLISVCKKPGGRNQPGGGLGIVKGVEYVALDRCRQLMAKRLQRQSAMIRKWGLLSRFHNPPPPTIIENMPPLSRLATIRQSLIALHPPSY